MGRWDTPSVNAKWKMENGMPRVTAKTAMSFFGMFHAQGEEEGMQDAGGQAAAPDAVPAPAKRSAEDIRSLRLSRLAAASGATAGALAAATTAAEFSTSFSSEAAQDGTTGSSGGVLEKNERDGQAQAMDVHASPREPKASAPITSLSIVISDAANALGTNADTPTGAKTGLLSPSAARSPAPAAAAKAVPMQRSLSSPEPRALSSAGGGVPSSGAGAGAGSPSKIARTAPTASTPTPTAPAASRATQAAFVLNLALESIFLFSLRPESAHSDSIKYIGDVAVVGSPRTMSAPAALTSPPPAPASSISSPTPNPAPGPLEALLLTADNIDVHIIKVCVSMINFSVLVKCQIYRNDKS